MVFSVGKKANDNLPCLIQLLHMLLCIDNLGNFKIKHVIGAYSSDTSARSSALSSSPSRMTSLRAT